jgi:hypothetical protein
MSTEQKGMGRRQFLVLSSVALAGAAVAPRAFASAPAVPSRIALGYAPLGEQGLSVTAASDVVASDGAFISRGARLTVHGAAGVSGAPGARRAVELAVNYTVDDGGTRQIVPFRAWAASRTTGEQARPGTFTVPVDAEQRISFAVMTETGRAPGRMLSRRASLAGTEGELRQRGTPLALTLQSDPQALKLARGHYVIVPVAEGEGEPRWSGYTVARNGDRMALVDSSGEMAPFEHLVVTVDYAAQ